MSRVGKAPVKLQSGVKVNLSNGLLDVQGPKGKLKWDVPEGVDIEIGKEEISVKCQDSKNRHFASMHGTARSVINNMVVGCSAGFKKEMDIVGVGYRAAVKGKQLSLTVGYSHPVDFPLPEGVTAKVEKNTHLVLECADRVLLGRVSAKIRDIRPPEPYQGKGIRYSDEKIIRKQGKAAGAGAK